MSDTVGEAGTNRVLVGIDASRAVVAQRTGTEVYSVHLIRELLALGTSLRFRLYFNQAPSEALFGEKIDARCEQRVIPFPRLWTHFRLSAEMLQHPPDVLLVPSHVLPLVHPRRSVVTVHDLGHRSYPEAHTWRQRQYLEWSAHHHVRHCAHLIADSGTTKEDLVRYYGADPTRVTVAHLGVDPRLRPVRDRDVLSAVRHKYGIDGPYLLYVGTVQPRKNLARLIEAFARICEQGEAADHTLVIAGKRGWLYKGILSRAQELGIGERVVLTGFVDDADLAALYSGARLFCMASLHEGFCMPVLEAMACGTPVACSNASSLPEVAGDAALLYDPHDVGDMADAIARALTDEALRDGLIERGLSRAQRFTWKACAQTVLRVLCEVSQY